MNRAKEITMVVSLSNFTNLNFYNKNITTQRHPPRIVQENLFRYRITIASPLVLNKVLYGGMPTISDKTTSRRLQLAGHCQRHPELCAHWLILWEPTHGRGGVGLPRAKYIDTLKSVKLRQQMQRSCPV